MRVKRSPKSAWYFPVLLCGILMFAALPTELSAHWGTAKIVTITAKEKLSPVVGKRTFMVTCRVQKEFYIYGPSLPDDKSWHRPFQIEVKQSETLIPAEVDYPPGTVVKEPTFGPYTTYTGTINSTVTIAESELQKLKEKNMEILVRVQGFPLENTY